MANSTPKQQLDLEDLALHEGATVLLRRTLAQLRAGDWFEVRGDSPQLVEQLAAWCRKEGHHCEPKLGVAGVYRIQSADSRRQSPRLRIQVSETADPTWASPSWRAVESGGPDPGFTLRKNATSEQGN
jgi:TusA-related sulfurtransferase